MFKTNIEMLKQVQHDKQEGRSMVEMLGVLAIIGVLSVGGVYGYTIAMRRYHANEIVQTASLLTIMAQAAKAGQGDCLTLSSAGLEGAAGGIDIEMKVETEVINDLPTVNVKIGDADSSDDKLCDAIEDLVADKGYHIQCSTDVSCSDA